MTSTYYVDSLDGDDAADGLSERGAWLTLPSPASLQPGDRLRLRRGGVWTRTAPWKLAANASESAPIVIDSYGYGAAPLVRFDAAEQPGSRTIFDLQGSYAVVRGLRFGLINPYRNPDYPEPDRTRGAKFGFSAGVTLSGSYNTVQDCEFHNLALGVNCPDGSDNNQVLGSHFHDLDMIWALGGAPGIMGGLGVMLHGLDNVVAGNRFERNGVTCYVAGLLKNYSAPVEFFKANGCQFVGNEAYGHRKNGEFGTSIGYVSAGNVYRRNLIISDVLAGRGVNIHGADEFGPVERTLVDHNTFLLTGAGSKGIISGQPGATVTNNICVAQEQAAWLRGELVENNNVFSGGRVVFA
jgi:hypothetical protein